MPILSLRLYEVRLSIHNDFQVTDRILSGLHIYMAGVGIQQLFILIFIFFAVKLHIVLRRGEGLAKQTQSRALILLYTMYAVLAFVTVRSFIPIMPSMSPID